MHVYEVRPREDKRGASNAIGHAEHYSRSHDAMIRVYDAAGNVIKRTSTGTISRVVIARQFY